MPFEESATLSTDRSSPTDETTVVDDWSNTDYTNLEVVDGFLQLVEYADLTAIDDFEDDDFSEYSGDTGMVSTTTSWSYNGDQALRFETDGSTQQIYSFAGDGLPAYYEIGTPFRCYVQLSNANDFCWVMFGATGTSSKYMVELNVSSDFCSLLSDNNENTTLDSSDFTISTGTTYEVEGLVGSDGAIDIRVTNLSDGTNTTLSTTNTDHTTSPAGIGFLANNQGGNSSDILFDYYNKGGSGPNDGVWSLTRHQVDGNYDGDGITMYDVNGDDAIDILAGDESSGGAHWYQQGSTVDDWTQYQISSGHTKIEGVAAEDIDNDGVVEAFVLDQGAGTVTITKPDGDPQNSWSTTVIDNDAANVQSGRFFDLDGDGQLEFVYAYEGSAAGDGGVYWLDFGSGDPLTAGNWTKHEMVQIEGAWGITHKRADLSGDGNATDFAFSCRGARNDAYEIGAYWLEEPTNIQDPWTLNIIDDTHAYSHINFGDMTGDGDRRDIVGCGYSGKGYDNAHWFDFSDAFSKYTVGDTGVTYYNAKPMPLEGTGRDEVILVDRNDDGALELWVYDEDLGDWTERDSVTIDKADDELPVHDIDGDGTPDFASVASNTTSVDWWEVNQP